VIYTHSVHDHLYVAGDVPDGAVLGQVGKHGSAVSAGKARTETAALMK
jgi:hypothetical protein